MMPVDERILKAALDSSTVVDAPPLLAAFNDAGVISPVDIQAAMGIARTLGEQDQEVMLAAALAVRGTRFGHVAIRPLDQPETIVVEGTDPDVINQLPWPDPAAWQASLEASSLVGAPGSGSPLVLEGDRLYLQRYHRYETSVAELLRARIEESAATIDGPLAEQLDALLGRDDHGNPTRQNEAARVALGGRLAVIAGGPGTGKTYAIAKMLQGLARLTDREFPRVALCAPTGKAAARLGEELTAAAVGEADAMAGDRMRGIEASTIHRLLGWHPARSRFRHDTRNLLPHDLVIVDEMSMVSLPLASKLISALRTDASLVLVGDPFQLESIEAGTVLADLVGPSTAGKAGTSTSAMAQRVVVLDQVHRFTEGGVIAEFATAVRRGDGDTAIELLHSGRDGLAWIESNSSEEFAELAERVFMQRSRVVELAREPGNAVAAIDALAKLAVLSAHRRGPGSVEAWRRQIEAALRERFPDLTREGEWYPGRPIMILKNDQNLRLYNGDIGVTAETEEGLRAVFKRDEVLTFPRSYLGEHEAVHALTIHKSQGSQFVEVVVSLPGESSRLLTRELLYTAVTRASEKVTIIGEEDVVRRAIERKVQRASGFESRLWS